ncbi:hypothetical protein [Cellulomonas sp.]|uniref:hypothetical protein n=1 Tax=Cellulomonas sp. TaxID=40001 RepID=UPI001B05552B|nr:hypothetical protein [Cellulomonas sp.]MBO9556844.1 hypothetical protein [Cellulomonas sp.]
MRRTTVLPVVAAVAALVLTGCTDGGSSPSDDETGPLSAFWEKVGGSYDQDEADAQQRKVEELIAACMSEQGFEYVPNEPQNVSRVMDGDDAPDWESREFAEQYGYGASTGDDLFGGGDNGEEWVDPNADYVAGMSEGEQTAFYEALYGTPPEVDPDADPDADMEYEYNWEEAGCQGSAQHEVYEQNQIWDDPAMQALNEEMSTEYENMADDPKLREAQEKWASCIADAGYDFTTPDEAQQSIYDELNGIYESAAPPENATEEELANFDYQPDATKMAELKEKEIALATADWKCKDSAGYYAAVKAANLAVEKRLWEKYGAQLEALVDKQTASE